MKNNNKKNQKAHPKKNSNLLLPLVAAIVVSIAVFTLFKPKDDQANTNDSNISAPASTTAAVINDDGDAVINVADISEKATFYSYDELNSKMEFLAIKASDGTIRTAFNTCQVCYSSGRGYYVQDGDVLVCQNCGNRFNKDQVEVTKGGCNPVPIFEDAKEVTDSTIIIPKETFEEAEVIFANRKN